MSTLDVAAAVGTIGAAGLALLSIEQNRRQARRAERARIRELRADFYLERLLQLSEGLEKGPGVAFADATVQLQLRMLPWSILPIIRVVHGVGLSEAALARYREVTKDWSDDRDRRLRLLPYMRQELVEAVAVYLSGDTEKRKAAAGSGRRRLPWRPGWRLRARANRGAG